MGNDSPVVGIGSEKAEVFGGKSEGGVRFFSSVKAPLLTLSLALAAAISVGEENSAQRLENAQRGMAGSSWPNKPDNRLSPLSGKMKEMAEISPRYYGQAKEFRAAGLNHLQKESSLGRRPDWEATEGRGWEQKSWRTQDDSRWNGKANRRFQLQESTEINQAATLQFPELARKPGPSWSSRSTRTAQEKDGSLKMYEGRLTRVREQVWSEESGPRDLGSGRQEKFSPDEVEKILSRPVGEPRGAAKEQSPEASRLAAADN